MTPKQAPRIVGDSFKAKYDDAHVCPLCDQTLRKGTWQVYIWPGDRAREFRCHYECVVTALDSNPRDEQLPMLEDQQPTNDIDAMLEIIREMFNARR